jgi:hypothetical protein
MECLNVATFDIFSSKYGEFLKENPPKNPCKFRDLCFCHQVAKFCTKNKHYLLQWDSI